MSVELFAIGGYNEVGRNMTAVKIDDEVVIFDMGLHIPNFITFTDDREEFTKVTGKALQNVDAAPHDQIIHDLKSKVVAIIPTHAHLDHIGAIPYLAGKYNAPVIGTPYTIEVLRTILKDEKIKIPNKCIVLNANTTYPLSKKLVVEFIHITHSAPQTVVIALHTPYGIIVYANDFKLDNTPVLGKKPNYAALKRIGDKGVIAAVVDSLYAPEHRKTPSEMIAREMLQDVLLNTEASKNAIVVTTFSSQIARLKSIIECGRKLGRTIVFVGRSLAKYSKAAENIGLVQFSKSVDIAKFRRHAERILKKVSKRPEKYLVVVTGNQGEPKSMLSRIAGGEFEFVLKPDDVVIFSCQTIPTEINIQQRRELEAKLKSYGVRIFTNVHASGHGSREDLREFLSLIRPSLIIPAHGNNQQEEGLMDLGKEMGFERNKTMFHLKNGDSLRLKR